MYAAPSSPRQVTVTATGAREVSVEWVEPQSRNGIIRFYLVTYYPAGNPNDNVTVNTNNSVTSAVIGMLIPYTEYAIRVAAVTVAVGTPSDPVIVRTNEAGKYTLNLRMQNMRI